MTKEEIKELWPAWRIEYICDLACEKLRNLCGVKYVFLESDEWDYWLDPKEEEYRIKLKFENQVDGSYLNIEFVDELFTSEQVAFFDKNIGADKLSDIKDKVILRLAWNLREKWNNR